MDFMDDNESNDINPELQETLENINEALLGLECGEVIIKVQGGKVIWVDRIDRYEKTIIDQ